MSFKKDKEKESDISDSEAIVPKEMPGKKSRETSFLSDLFVHKQRGVVYANKRKVNYEITSVSLHTCFHKLSWGFKYSSISTK